MSSPCGRPQPYNLLCVGWFGPALSSLAKGKGHVLTAWRPEAGDRHAGADVVAASSHETLFSSLVQAKAALASWRATTTRLARTRRSDGARTPAELAAPSLPSGSGAPPDERLRAGARRHRPLGQNQRRKRTQNRIKPGATSIVTVTWLRGTAKKPDALLQA